MAVRAKFKLHSIETFEGDSKQYHFYAVYDDGTPENRRFARYSPSGELKILVDNPEVNFDIGKEYYLDFTPAVAPATDNGENIPPAQPSGEAEA